MWFWQEWQINKAVAQSKLERKHAIWCLEEALRLHNLFVRALLKPEETDIDEAIREWDLWTLEVLDIVEDGQSKLITFDDAIMKMKEDAAIHQWYIDNPSYATGSYGNIAWQIKWRDRWNAVAKLLEKMKP